MTDLLQTGSDWLLDQQKAHCSKAVTYQRPGHTAIQVQATIGRSTFEIQDDHGVVEEVEARDFLIQAADLEEGVGCFILPEAGDLIKEVLAGETVVFEVTAVGDEPPWRYSDPYRKTVRVHTKQVDVQ